MTPAMAASPFRIWEPWVTAALVLMGVASVSVMEGVKVVPSVTVPLMLAVVVPLLLLLLLLAGTLSLLRTLGVILPIVAVLLRLLGFGMVLLFDTVLLAFGVDVFTGVVLLAFDVLFDTLLEPVALLDVADSVSVTLTEAQND